MRNIISFFFFTALVIACSKDDNDDNKSPQEVLNFVTIGTQDWSSENADVVTYRDGTPIPQVSDETEWANLTTGAWCYYDNDPNKGKLYNWYAVAGIHDNDPSTPNKEFAPMGWHVPTDLEWTTLENYLIANGYNYDDTTSENKIAKALASNTGWHGSLVLGAPGQDQTTNNSSGFNAFPLGARLQSFQFYGDYADFWTATETNDTNAPYFYLSFNNFDLGSGLFVPKYIGQSVRFVRD